MVDVTFLAGVAVARIFGGCAAGVAASCALLAVGGGTWCGDVSVGCEECHQLGGLGKKFLLLSLELLEAVVLCRGECGGVFLGVLEGIFETVGVLKDGLVVVWR